MIYKILGNYIKRRLHDNVYRPQRFGDLSFAFTGPRGHAYYTWQDLGDMPASRLFNIQVLMRQADEGMSRGDMEAIADEIKKEAVAALKATKPNDSIARIIALGEEIKRRSDGIIPEDIFYDIAATCAIREDEDPQQVERIIHLEKFNEFREAGRAGWAFFTMLPPLIALVESSVTSMDGFARSLINWETRRARIAARMAVISSIDASGSTATTTTDSPSASPGATPSKPRPWKRSA